MSETICINDEAPKDLLCLLVVVSSHLLVLRPVGVLVLIPRRVFAFAQIAFCCHCSFVFLKG